jgi:hypothetical protein
LNSK